jgi:hypothetical protein
LFQLKLEQLMSMEAQCGIALPGISGTFLKIFSGADSEYDSNEAENYYPGCKCFFLHVEHPPIKDTEVTPSAITPTRQDAQLQEKAGRLKA